MKNKMKKWFLQIFATKIGLLAVSVVLIIVFGILGDKYEWAETAMMFSWLYPIGLTLVMMVYAWIINPIRDYKERKQNKK
jgi:formate/nitrite transporter FocA (FNT family)